MPGISGRESKQSKQFCELALRVIKGKSRKEVRAVYKTIKHGKNATYQYYGAAMQSLEKKKKLDTQVLSYNSIIQDTTKFTIREVQNAKSHLAKLVFSEETKALCTEIETAFGLDRGYLMPKTHGLSRSLGAPRNNKKRSHSVSHNRDHDPAMPSGSPRFSQPAKSLTLHSADMSKAKERRFSSSYGARNATRARTMHGRQRSRSNVSMQSGTITSVITTIVHDDDDDDDDLSSSDDDEEEEEDFNENENEPIPRSPSIKVNDRERKQRSNSLSYRRDRRGSGVPAFHARDSSANPRDVPSQDKPKEYMEFLAQRAITNKMWNENDADRLCKSAVHGQEEWVTVHSMWVTTVEDLLLKYTKVEFKEEKRKSAKAGRRGSRSSFQIRKQFENVADENEIKDHDTKICVIVGFPFGQMSTAAKMAEAESSVKDGAEKIRLMINGAKVVAEDWDYITKEVESVMDACGVEVKVVLPDTSQISEDAKTKFNSKINEFMETRAKEKPSAKMPVHAPEVTPVSPRGLVGGALPSLPSRMEVEQSEDAAYTSPKPATTADDEKTNASPLATGSPQSIHLNASPLSESGTQEVANTPNTAAEDVSVDVPEEDASKDEDDIPDVVPMMVTVVSETGDELLHLESPKKSSKKEPAPIVVVEEESAVDSTPNLSPKKKKKGTKSGDKTPGHKAQKSGSKSPKKKGKHKAAPSKDKGKHKAQKSGSKHKAQKSGSKSPNKKAKKKKSDK